MGFDRFANFITRNIPVDDVNITVNERKFIANHIFFDINFLIYQTIANIENEINNIIKIILSINSVTDIEIPIKLLDIIFSQPHWTPYHSKKKILSILDGETLEDIISNFSKWIKTKIKTPFGENQISQIDLIIYEKICIEINKFTNNLYIGQHIESINLFFDGIPSVSKVIEQRRRRVKNFMESQVKKKLFDDYFSEFELKYSKIVDNINGMDDIEGVQGLVFDNLKWLSNRIILEKSFGSTSPFIMHCECYLKDRIGDKVYINSGKNIGEADVKIFQHLENMTGDIVIHSTDSDFLHLILTQQIFWKIMGKDINLSLMRHSKNEDIVQYFDSNNMIGAILDLYMNINNIKTSNYKIIWDICLIFNLFGNDHMPSSLEIGPELELKYFLKCHYEALGKSNIINSSKSFKTNSNDNIIFSFENLQLYLIKLSSSINSTKIILNRFFKVSSQFVSLVIDKMNLDFDGILEFLNKYIMYSAKQLYDNNKFDDLDINDMRRKYKSDMIIEDMSKYDEVLNNNLDFCEEKYNGLILYNKPQYITTDSFQTIYNYLLDKTTNILSEEVPQFYDFITIEQHLDLLKSTKYDNNAYDWLLNLYWVGTTLCSDISKYSCNNIIWYKYIYCPQIIDIINLLDVDSIENIKKLIKTDIENSLVKDNKYLTTAGHHLLITPHIISINTTPQIKIIVDKLKNIKELDNLWLQQKKSGIEKIIMSRLANFFSSKNNMTEITWVSENPLIGSKIIDYDYDNWNYRNIDIKFFINIIN